MINFPKSQPAPKCLAEEKKKKSGDYKCGEVLKRLQKDFLNKCYICEDKGITSINVEHFKSHEGDIDLKFDWNNLLYACSHCNNTKNVKRDKFDNILNCTNKNDKILEWISFEIESFPKEKAIIRNLVDDTRVKNTVELLEKVYNGHTTNIKQLEAANLRSKLLDEINDFKEVIKQFKNPPFQIPGYKKMLKDKITDNLKSSSPFTAFKVWIIKEDKEMSNRFKLP